MAATAAGGPDTGAMAAKPAGEECSFRITVVHCFSAPTYCGLSCIRAGFTSGVCNDDYHCCCN